MVSCGSNTPKGDSSSDESGQVSSTIISDSKVLENTSEDNSSIAGESENKGNSGASSSTSGTASLLKNEVSNVASSAKPVATPTPEAPKPTEAPVATPAPTPTPEAPKCGAVGHSVDGTCAVCGSSYTTPVATPAPTPVPTPPPAVTCPTCGSTAHAQHPAPDVNKEHDVVINPGDGEGDNPTIGK